MSQFVKRQKRKRDLCSSQTLRKKTLRRPTEVILKRKYSIQQRYIKTQKSSWNRNEEIFATFEAFRHALLRSPALCNALALTVLFFAVRDKEMRTLLVVLACGLHGKHARQVHSLVAGNAALSASRSHYRSPSSPNAKQRRALMREVP